MLLEAWLWSLIPTFLIAVPVTTVYLHRTVTHRALTMRPMVETAFKFLNWISTGTDPAVWAAVHRKHHAFSDQEIADDKRDPHSPWLEGFWHIQLGNVYYYLAELRKHPETLTKYAGDVIEARTWWDRHVFSHAWLGLGLGQVVLCGVLGLHAWVLHGDAARALADGLRWGAVSGLLHAATFVLLLNPSINALCHWPHRVLGSYQHSKAAHALTTFNNWIVALLTAGEGFHHNHHWKQRSARFAHTWWEMPADWGYWAVIRPLEATKLAARVRRDLPATP